MEKHITPAFEQVGKRKKLTGYIGQLVDGETVIHSKEYSTYSEAEIALDALAFDLLIDQSKQKSIDKPAQCACGKFATWRVGFADEPKEEFFCDDHLDKFYIADPITIFVPSTCCFCHKPHHPQDCPEMRALLFAPFVDVCISCGDQLHYDAHLNTVCGECQKWAAPIDVDFAPIGPEVER